ncbi:Spc7 kinetochore protein-domain-containing protein [Mycena rebaudengoi]|nr:Spc7 kinetochore protein-domain-containing protein [Mycena rebaudengoi]
MVKEHPARRKSIAGTNQNRPTGVLKGKRRAHSIVPGDMSPRAKARRLAAPRKSILKATINLVNTDEPNSLDAQSLTQGPFQFPAATEEPNATQSMDLTTDFQTQIHDNPSRKSFARRVSFANTAHVRLIDPREKDNTNGTDSPQSSPAASSDSIDPAPPAALSDENAYPGRNRRRSSVRQSMGMGSDDMDLTMSGSDAFLFASQANGSALVDEDMEFDDDDDMEITEALDVDLVRKRSLSLGGGRKPLSQISVATPDDADQSQSFTDDQSQSFTDDPSQDPPTEFTIPLNKSLRPPAHEDATWMALRNATHSGNTPYEEPPPSSDDEYVPVSRDGAGAARRVSLAPAPTDNQYIPQDDSFSSTDDSFGDADQGDRTINISKVMGRVSLAGEGIRMSMGQPDSTMDESEIYGSIIPPPTESTPVQPRNVSIPQPSRPSIFRPMSPKKNATPVPLSPSKAANKPTFSVAAPKRPSEANRPPSPKKRPYPDDRDTGNPTPAKRLAVAGKSTALAANPAPSPNKRPHPGDSEADKPSPAKRLAMAGKWTPASPAVVTRPPAPPADVSKPKPLSPSKKAPFLAQAQTQAPRPPSALRRPSGYFARRKSLGIGLGAADAGEPEVVDGPSTLVARTSPKKKAGLGLGRASLGSAPASSWVRPNKSAVPDKGKQKQKPIEDDSACVREAERQAAASPSPTRGSPSPASPRVASPLPTRPPGSPSPVVDLSAMLDSARGFGELDVDMEADPTAQWRDGAQEAGVPDDEERPISIEQFFDITGITFMDELDAPRRSIHQPSRQPRPPSEISLSEYAVALSIDMPELVLYSAVCNDLQGWMDQSKAVFAQEEEEATKMTPELFTEYIRADEEGQAELRHQLNLIRTNARGLAKSEWYDWKLRWIEGLREKADKGFEDLTQDALAIEKLQAIPKQVLPVLEREYEDIMRELAQQQAEVAEIESSDQEYLNELKASIAEQNVVVEAYQAEVAESNAQLEWLQERLQELDLEKRQARTAIADANRILHIQKNSTHAELFRLNQELNDLQDLHMFRATKVLPDLFEYVYASQFRVSIPCRNFVPIVAKVEISRLETSRHLPDDFPALSRFFLDNATRHITTCGTAISTRQIVQQLADYWSACGQIRMQLFQLTIKYPLEIQILSSGQEFRAKVVVLFPAVKAKAFIYFIFSSATFSGWPISIGSLRHDVEVVYGAVDPTAISKAVSDRLDQASPADNYACLMDACIEAQVLY